MAGGNLARRPKKGTFHAERREDLPEGSHEGEQASFLAENFNICEVRGGLGTVADSRPQAVEAKVIFPPLQVTFACSGELRGKVLAGRQPHVRFGIRLF